MSSLKCDEDEWWTLDLEADVKSTPPCSEFSKSKSILSTKQLCILHKDTV